MENAKSVKMRPVAGHWHGGQKLTGKETVEIPESSVESYLRIGWTVEPKPETKPEMKKGKDS